ncbi:MAG: triphosphoribosyl-dephospho-CoA synthase [Candidatus Thorarchaeota archaeon]|nr:triphosphoribosyl-dephospho-CoA synthase [Candidatus Thorarchaeota archaeon]
MDHMRNPHVEWDMAWTLASLGQLAILLEASSPKPGNVNRLRRFSDTGYRHFLASAALAGRGFHLAASRGIQAAEASLSPERVGMGEVVRLCIQDVFGGINRSNAILGSVLLHVPILMASAASIRESGVFDPYGVGQWMRCLVDATTVHDTIEVYRAFRLAGPIGSSRKDTDSWTEQHSRYDIDNPNVDRAIEEDNMTLKRLFDLSAQVDEISKEWSQYFETTLFRTLPVLEAHSSGLDDLEEGVVRAFIWLLSERPDGLIVKKAGRMAAERVRRLAMGIVREMKNHQDVTQLLEQLDNVLRVDGNRLNPGTTADLISAALLCRLTALYYHPSPECPRR